MKLNRMFIYFNNKISGYKTQDKNANRIIDEKQEYLNANYIINELAKNDNKCTYCKNSFEIGIDEDENYTTNITMDRINNSLPHYKNNCVLSCLLCNCSKSNK